MKRKKLRVFLDFDLTLRDGEKLASHSFTEFRKSLKNFVYDWDSYFYAYYDGKNGAYDCDIIPSNIKIKITNRED